MLSFAAFLVEHAAASTILATLAATGTKPANAPGVQFILPDGQGVTVDNRDVHAQAVHTLATRHGLDFRLIDVMQAGCVRVAHPDRFQVCNGITAAQAQAMVDSATGHYTELTVSVANAQIAVRDEAENDGVGPITIDDLAYKYFDLDKAKPATVRNWVNQQQF
jgi:hypothetical protein